MPLLKSLLCIKGFDNGRRFLVISLSCYLFLLILSPILAKAAILLVILLLVCTPILAASAIRRIHDAGFATPIAIVPVIVFLICVFGVTFMESSASWALLVIAVLVTIAITTMTNAKVSSNARVRGAKDYVRGYSGPVNLNNQSIAPGHHYHNDRIEPTLVAAHGDEKGTEFSRDAEQHTGSEQFSADIASSDSFRTDAAGTELGQTRNNDQWEKKLGDRLIANRQLSIIVASVIFVAVISIVIGSFFEQEVEEQKTKVIQQPVVEKSKERLNKLEMPDNFWIMLDKFDALTVAWQGDYKSDGQVWSAITGEGDSACVEISFNRVDKYRSMEVSVKNNGDYYADFSPVDTQKIVQAIALRDRFKLCGYEFSLKGTQAKLMNNKKYASYFEE